MADSSPLSTYSGRMAKKMDPKTAQTLLDYVTSDTPKTNFNPVENAYGSGPGGADATALATIRKIQSTNSPSEKDQISGDTLHGKLTRSIEQRGEVRGIYDDATAALKKKKQSRYNMLDDSSN